MAKIIGFFGVISCVIGGFALNGGHVPVLWQPTEVLVIVGSAIFAYIIANPTHVLKETPSSIASIFKKPLYSKAEFIELLSMLCLVFKLYNPIVKEECEILITV